MEQPHVYTVDRRTGLTTIVRTNPTVKLVSKDHADVYWQNGKFYANFDATDPLDEKDVPAEALEWARANSARLLGYTHERVEDTIRTCPLCDTPLASSKFEDHLLEHARSNPRVALRRGAKEE